MTYPIEFTPFNWEDLPSENTPFDKENAQTAEKRLAKFTVEYEVHWRYPVKKESELPKVNVAKGDIFLVEETRELLLYDGVEYVKLNTFVPYWKPPVTKASELPIVHNVVGDVRLVLETSQLYICVSTTGTISEQWHIYEALPHHWMPPVIKESELPTSENTIGDVRVVVELKQLFLCVATTGSIEEQWLSFPYNITQAQLSSTLKGEAAVEIKNPEIQSEITESGKGNGEKEPSSTKPTEVYVYFETEAGKAASLIIEVNGIIVYQFTQAAIATLQSSNTARFLVPKETKFKVTFSECKSIIPVYQFV